jgi:hypothetical protein
MAALASVLAALQALACAAGRRDIRGQLESTAKGVAVSVAQMLMADAGEYRAFLASGDRGGPYCEKMRRLLATIRDESGVVRHIYVVGALGAGGAGRVLDAGPERASAPKEKKRGGGRGGQITSYAPVLDGDGGALGLVGVDIDGTHLDRQFRRMNAAMSAASLVIAALSLALLLRFSDAILDCASRDGLAWAFSKARFERELGAGVSRAARRGHGVALALVEPDPPGGGHRLALAHVSGAVADSVAPGCLLGRPARYGSRGMALVLAPAGAAEAAEALRRAVEARPAPDGDGPPAKITVSVGVAVGGPSAGPADLVCGAERALAEAKAKGNSVVTA